VIGVSFDPRVPGESKLPHWRCDSPKKMESSAWPLCAVREFAPSRLARIVRPDTGKSYPLRKGTIGLAPPIAGKAGPIYRRATRRFIQACWRAHAKLKRNSGNKTHALTGAAYARAAGNATGSWIWIIMSQKAFASAGP
jgi:hypothetical protein